MAELRDVVRPLGRRAHRSLATHRPVATDAKYSV